MFRVIKLIVIKFKTFFPKLLQCESTIVFLSASMTHPYITLSCIKIIYNNNNVMCTNIFLSY